MTGLLVSLASCERRVDLTVLVEPGLEAQWDSLVAAHPLPEPFAVSSAEGADPVIRLFHRGPMDSDEDGTSGASGTTPIVFERQWLAPVVSIADPREEVSNSDLDSVDLAEFDDIAPPLKALAVDGLVVGDQGYPLVSDTVVAFSPERIPERTRDEERALLTEWYLGLRHELPAPEVFWVGAVGDIMPGRGVTELLDRADGLELVLGDLVPYLQGADLLIGNFEGAITTRGTPLEKSYTFRLNPRVLGPLVRAGFDYLSLTNNHSFDYGLVGFTDSLDHLAEAGIATSGVGMTIEEASIPSFFTFGASDVAVLSVGAYPAEQSGFDGAVVAAAGPAKPGVLWAGQGDSLYETALQAMRSAFSNDTFDIVVVHGGREWAVEPDQWQRERYESFIDAGADLVLGSHSHVLQGLEAYDGSIIAHSLGNFIFPGMYGTDYGEESAILLLGVSRGVVRYVRFVPVRINHQTVARDTGDAIINRFFAATAALNGE